MFKTIRKMDQIEREEERRAACNWKKLYFQPCMCSKAMPPQIHVLFNLILYALQLHISPSLYLILLFSPRLTLPDFSFLLYPLLDDFHVFFCGVLQVFPELLLKQKRETFRFCQKAFSSWRRSSRGNSQMMTAIVKGQISPCGFASDCMFISF